jgi:hypothetical protein
VVKLPTAKRGFILLPRRWVVESSFAWMARFRRLVRDQERLCETLACRIWSPSPSRVSEYTWNINPNHTVIFVKLATKAFARLTLEQPSHVAFWVSYSPVACAGR